MSGPSILGLRDAIVATLQTRLPAIKRISGYGGELNIEEIERVGTGTTPAVLLVAIRSDTEIQGGMVVANILWAAFVVVRDGDLNAKRTDAALAIAMSLLAIVGETKQRWGTTSGVGVVRNLNAINGYSGKLDAKGVALWCVHWRQQLDLPPDEASAHIAKLFTVDVELLSTKNPGEVLAEDTITLPPCGEGGGS